MNARMLREYEIRGVADRDLAEVPRAKLVGEVKCSQAMYDELALVMRCEAVSAERLAELRGLIDRRLAAARRVTA